MESITKLLTGEQQSALQQMSSSLLPMFMNASKSFVEPLVYKFLPDRRTPYMKFKDAMKNIFVNYPIIALCSILSLMLTPFLVTGYFKYKEMEALRSTGYAGAFKVNREYEKYNFLQRDELDENGKPVMSSDGRTPSRELDPEKIPEINDTASSKYFIAVKMKIADAYQVIRNLFEKIFGKKTAKYLDSAMATAMKFVATAVIGATASKLLQTYVTNAVSTTVSSIVGKSASTVGADFVKQLGAKLLFESNRPNMVITLVTKVFDKMFTFFMNIWNKLRPIIGV